MAWNILGHEESGRGRSRRGMGDHLSGRLYLDCEGLFFFNFWLHWAFVSASRLSLRAVRGGFCGAKTSHCFGFSCCGTWALGEWALVVVPHGLSYPVACGIFLDQGSNPCPLHWRVDS